MAGQRKSAKPVVLLSGGNPQIAKADGDAPVQAYIAAMPDWKRAIGKRLDALIVRNVPNVRKAVKWNSPMYGVDGQSWFVSFHVFARYVKVTFFRGTSLRPVPPGGTAKDARWIDIHEDDLDEAQMAKWIKQAAALPGWKRPIGQRVDALVMRTVPDARKAVKWNSPFYGLAGNGWFLSLHCFAKYVRLAFFRGGALEPPPPGASKLPNVRYLDIHEDDQIDEAQLSDWFAQAACLPGWSA